MERGNERPPQPVAPLVDMLALGVARGVPAPDLLSRMHRYFDAQHIRVVCLECNADQMAGLCAELSRDIGMRTVALHVDDALRATGPPVEMAHADVLVTTFFHAPAAQSLAARPEIPCIVAASSSGLIAEIARELERGPVFYVIGDARFAIKLRDWSTWAPHPENLRLLVAGRDEMRHIPAGATVCGVRPVLLVHVRQRRGTSPRRYPFGPDQHSRHRGRGTAA